MGILKHSKYIYFYRYLEYIFLYRYLENQTIDPINNKKNIMTFGYTGPQNNN